MKNYPPEDVFLSYWAFLKQTNPISIVIMLTTLMDFASPPPPLGKKSQKAMFRKIDSFFHEMENHMTAKKWGSQVHRGKNH